MFIKNILVVDDDVAMLEIISIILNGMGYKVFTTENVEDALSIISIFQIDFLILDYNLDTATTAEDLLNKMHTPIDFIILSASNNISTVVEMMKRGAIDFVIKDKSVNETLPLVMRRIEKEKKTSNALKSTEIQLELTKTYLKDLTDSISYAILGIDAELNIAHANIVAKTVFYDKKSDIVGSNLTSVVSCDNTIYSIIRKAIVKRTKLKLESIELKDGRHFSIKLFEIKPEKNRYVIIMEDITEKEKMNDLFIQSEKMSSVGKLTTSIAHEINNPLGGILQGVQLIKQRIYGDSDINDKIAKEQGVSLEDVHHFLDARDIDKYLDIIYNGGTKVAKIIENIISFSKVDEDHELYDINKVLKDTIRIVQNSSDIITLSQFDTIEFKINILDYETIIKCNISEIKQVILGLIKNAIQSFDDFETAHKHITLNITTSDNYAILSIKDNGCGIEKDNMQRIFEPFFTTQDVGQGEGLGLTMIYYIVTRNHSGYIEINSDSDKARGTEVLVKIPLAH